MHGYFIEYIYATYSTISTIVFLIQTEDKQKAIYSAHTYMQRKKNKYEIKKYSRMYIYKVSEKRIRTLLYKNRYVIELDIIGNRK